MNYTPDNIEVIPIKRKKLSKFIKDNWNVDITFGKIGFIVIGEKIIFINENCYFYELEEFIDTTDMKSKKYITFKDWVGYIDGEIEIPIHYETFVENSLLKEKCSLSKFVKTKINNVIFDELIKTIIC